MGKGKKYVSMSIIFSFFISFSSPIFAKECGNESDIFAKYECRVKNICDTTDYNDSNKVFNPEKFKKAGEYKNVEVSDLFLKTSREEKPIKKAVSVYKENMNSIYKCAMIGIQKNALLNIKDRLKVDKTGDIKKSVGGKIDIIINRLNEYSSSSKCMAVKKESTVNKLSILKQATQMTCQYAFYIDYLKEYYKDPANALGIDNVISSPATGLEEIDKAYMLNDAATKMKSIQDSLDEELAHSLKIFPIAFQAYSEYENNYPIHFLLELLKEDFVVFREKLHQVLNPINQVGYKIVNAMKK